MFNLRRKALPACPNCRHELSSVEATATFQAMPKRYVVINNYPALRCENCGLVLTKRDTARDFVDYASDIFGHSRFKNPRPSQPCQIFFTKAQLPAVTARKIPAMYVPYRVDCGFDSYEEAYDFAMHIAKNEHYWIFIELRKKWYAVHTGAAMELVISRQLIWVKDDGLWQERTAYNNQGREPAVFTRMLPYVLGKNTSSDVQVDEDLIQELQQINTKALKIQPLCALQRAKTYEAGQRVINQAVTTLAKCIRLPLLSSVKQDNHKPRYKGER